MRAFPRADSNLSVTADAWNQRDDARNWSCTLGSWGSFVVSSFFPSIFIFFFLFFFFDGEVESALTAECAMKLIENSDGE